MSKMKKKKMRSLDKIPLWKNGNMTRKRKRPIIFLGSETLVYVSWVDNNADRKPLELRFCRWNWNNGIYNALKVQSIPLLKLQMKIYTYKHVYLKYDWGFIVLCMRVLSHVWLFATPQTVAHQLTVAPLSMGFSRQANWRGLPFPTPHSSLKIT